MLVRGDEVGLLRLLRVGSIEVGLGCGILLCVYDLVDQDWERQLGVSVEI